MKGILFSLAFAFSAATASAGTVEVTTFPESPVVIDSDITMNWFGQTEKIYGPWFKFGVNINNTSVDPVTIVGLHIEITGTDENGIPMTVTKDFDPGMFNYSMNAMNCSYTDFGQFEPLVVPYALGLQSADSFCYGGAIWFYVSASDFKYSSMRAFSVKVQPMGWVGGRQNPKSRFDGFTTIVTQ